MTKLTEEECHDIDKILHQEWLETNGLGGYSSATLSGMNTRRFHGLLVVGLDAACRRHVLVSKLEETVFLGDRIQDLSCNQYPGSIYPQGYQNLVEFRLNPYPVFVYRVPGGLLEKSIFMIHGENATVCRYRMKWEVPMDENTHLDLELRPLVNGRHHNELLNTTDFNDYATMTYDQHCVRCQIKAEIPPIFFTHNAIGVHEDPRSYLNFEYLRDMERGEAFHDHAYNPCVMRYRLTPNEPVAVMVSATRPFDVKTIEIYRRAEIKRRQEELETVAIEDENVKPLLSAAAHYLYKANDHRGIISGYPWLDESARETMVSFTGLVLLPGKFDVARHILKSYAERMEGGIIVDQSNDNEQTIQTAFSADTSLWYLEAVRSFLAYTNDYRFVKDHLYPKLKTIINVYHEGAKPGMKADKDGLIILTNSSLALTWMNAYDNGAPVTPRLGKPVEIQALWFNALKIMEDVSEIFGDNKSQSFYSKLAKKVFMSFNEQFWLEDKGYLCDVVGNGGNDIRIRPNQLLALSLYHSLVDSEKKGQKILKCVEETLLTPVGLRTLAPFESNYHSEHRGDLVQRVHALHNGIVHQWLMGAFLEGYIKIYHHSQRSKKQAREWLHTILKNLNQCGVGQLGQMYNAEEPFYGTGSPSYAMSVAEILRVAVEDVFLDNGDKKTMTARLATSTH